MSIKNRLIAAIITVLFASNSNAADNKKWDAYEKLAEKVEATIRTASIEKLTNQSVELMMLAKKFLPEFTNSQTVCKKYIEAVLSASNTMLALSLDDIERDYHSDAKLPSVASPACYYAKDLLVHPATMIIMAKTQKDTKETREKMGLEVEEVLNHFSFVKQAAGI